MGHHPNSLANLRPGPHPGTIPFHDPRRPRCEAIARTTGQRCRREAMPGQTRCACHGTKPQTPERKARNAAISEALARIQRMGGAPRDLKREAAWRDAPGDAGARWQRRANLLEAWNRIPEDGGAAWRAITAGPGKV